MAERKKTGRVRSTVKGKKRQAGSRITGRVRGGTRSTTQEGKRRSDDSKTVGSFVKRPEGLGDVGSERWDGEHVRQGLRLPGDDPAVWLEEAAHYLAMALCHYLWHDGKPCSQCIKWAEEELSFAIMQKGAMEDDSGLRTLGLDLGRASRDLAAGSSGGDVVGSGVSARAKGNRDAPRKGTQ